MLEPHLDALSILGRPASPSAANTTRRPSSACAPAQGRPGGCSPPSRPGSQLDAVPDGDGWRLRGTKPWCSLAAHLTHALVTASVEGEGRRLFAVDLRDSRVRPHEGPWFARGLHDVVSAAVDFEDAPAVPVGETGWYLDRPGFAWGGMSVAACWWGAAVGHRRAAAGGSPIGARRPARAGSSGPSGCRALGGARRARRGRGPARSGPLVGGRRPAARRAGARCRGGCRHRRSRRDRRRARPGAARGGRAACASRRGSAPLPAPASRSAGLRPHRPRARRQRASDGGERVMVTFSHLDGHVGGGLAADERLRATPPLHVDLDALVVVAAHPDDETLGAARPHSAGAPEGRDRRSSSRPTARHPIRTRCRTRGPTSARVRRGEVMRAVHALAPGARVHFLALPDGALRENTQTLDEALACRDRHRDRHRAPAHADRRAVVGGRAPRSSRHGRVRRAGRRGARSAAPRLPDLAVALGRARRRPVGAGRRARAHSGRAFDQGAGAAHPRLSDAAAVGCSGRRARRLGSDAGALHP